MREIMIFKHGMYTFYLMNRLKFVRWLDIDVVRFW